MVIKNKDNKSNSKAGCDECVKAVIQLIRDIRVQSHYQGGSQVLVWCINHSSRWGFNSTFNSKRRLPTYLHNSQRTYESEDGQLAIHLVKLNVGFEIHCETCL